MARVEADREDLLREATALVERVELDLRDDAAPVVVGFRAGGAVSFYFGAEPVYQFTAGGALRRAYADGRLTKAEKGRLVALVRQRTDGAVRLVRDDWDDAACLAFFTRAEGDLGRLRAALDTGRFTVVGQFPPDVDVVGRVRRWLDTLPARLSVADSARVS